MTPLTVRRWRGLTALLQDAVEHGSHAVERVHRETARRPFAALEKIPVVALPARGVHLVHDTIMAAVYGLIRLSTRAVAASTDTLLDVVAHSSTREEGR